MRFEFICALALIGLTLPTSALAECKPLALVTSVDFVPGEEDRAVLLPVTIQGQDRYMIVDTGASVSAISEAAADDLGLKRTNGNLVLTDITGHETTQQTTASIKIGRLAGSQFGMMVMHNTSFGDPKIVGLLGRDVLMRYDIDIDFGKRKFNLLNPDHCEGKLPYWQASAVAVVPMIVMYNGDIQFSVTLDDKPVTAVLDTGASNTTLSLEVAENQYGLKPNSPDMPATGSLEGSAAATTYFHIFKSLGFEGIAVANPHIDIIPDLFHSQNLESSQTFLTRLPDPRSNYAKQSMLLGMNIMRHFHFYIAWKEKQIYITPAEGAPPPAPAAPDAATTAH